MRIIEGRLRVAASDVANFLACQQLTQLDLQAAAGRVGRLTARAAPAPGPKLARRIIADRSDVCQASGLGRLEFSNAFVIQSSFF